MKKIIYISISCVLVLLVIGGIVLAHINMLKKDFIKSDYKHIRIKSSWDKIYCEGDNRIVCAETKDGYIEVYDADLKYLKKIKLPEYKKIKINGNDIVIVKQDGTVWSCDTYTNDDFIKIDVVSDVDNIYPSYWFLIYKDIKGDFFYLENRQRIKDSHVISIKNQNEDNKPHLINDLKDAEIISFDVRLVYIKNGNTYIKYRYRDKDGNSILFDKDNNVNYDTCIDGIKYKNAIEQSNNIYLFDKTKSIVSLCGPEDNGKKIGATEPIKINMNTNKITATSDDWPLYALDKKGKLYEIAIYSDDKVSLFKYKKFKNIYGGRYLYATDDKYLYKLDK